jgi:hypothetical protein
MCRPRFPQSDAEETGEHLLDDAVLSLAVRALVGSIG